MKQNTILFLLISVLSLSACGQNPEDARKELGEMNIPYSEDAFLQAAGNGDIMAVKLFLAAGMNVNANSKWEQESPLAAAVSNGRIEVVDFLLDKGADPNANGGKPLQQAVSGGSVEIVQKLLEKGATLNSGASLIVALHSNHLEIAKLLLAKGIDDPNVTLYGQTALEAAIEKSSIEIVQDLLRRGANPNTKIQYPPKSLLMAASEKGNIAIIDALLKGGANVNETSGSALRSAVQGKHFDAVKALLAAGADPNIGYSILSIAINEGLVDIVNALLESKADPNAKIVIGSEWGSTPLMAAIGEGNIPIAKLLLQHGANINAISVHQRTPLLIAVGENNEEAVRFLIENGANVNAANEGDRTSLDLAYYFKLSPNIIKMLVDAGGKARHEKGSAVVSFGNPLKSKSSIAVPAPASAETQTKAAQTPSINPTTRASSPSFDCAKASSGSEHLICSNANLAAVDVEMVQIYKKVFKNTTDTKTLKREQNQWRKTHRDACKDVACLLNVYAVRIKQLNEQQTK